MRACARANCAARCGFAASGIISAPPPSTDPCASRRSVAPISRGHANALGFQHPGAFCFSRSQRNRYTQKTRVHRAPEASGHAGPSQGKPRRRRDAPCLDASARAARGMQRTRIGAFGETPQAPMRNIARTVHSGAGCVQEHGLPGARGAAVAHAGDREKVFRERTEAQGKSSGASRWPPVRIRFVHHWIAQSGRASVSKTECCGFDSRSKQRPVTSLPMGRKSRTRKRPRAFRSIAIDRDAKRIRSGDVAGPSPWKRTDWRQPDIAMDRDAGPHGPARTARRLRGIGAGAFPISSLPPLRRRRRGGLGRGAF